MSSERLNGLATLCIEKKVLDAIDTDASINNFTSANIIKKFKITFIMSNKNILHLLHCLLETSLLL